MQQPSDLAIIVHSAHHLLHLLKGRESLLPEAEPRKECNSAPLPWFEIGSNPTSFLMFKKGMMHDSNLSFSSGLDDLFGVNFHASQITAHIAFHSRSRGPTSHSEYKDLTIQGSLPSNSMWQGPLPSMRPNILFLPRSIPLVKDFPDPSLHKNSK